MPILAPVDREDLEEVDVLVVVSGAEVAEGDEVDWDDEEVDEEVDVVPVVSEVCVVDDEDAIVFAVAVDEDEVLVMEEVALP